LTPTLTPTRSESGPEERLHSLDGLTLHGGSYVAVEV
jgi:hypothetical protein